MKRPGAVPTSALPHGQQQDFVCAVFSFEFGGDATQISFDAVTPDRIARASSIEKDF
jgi:hypothetical protein